MIVPSRTPSMVPANSREAAQARSASVVSKPILVIPNSFPVRRVMAFTKASPDSITTLAITSILTPSPSMAQPVTSDRICEAYPAGVKPDSSAIEQSMKKLKSIAMGICRNCSFLKSFFSSAICPAISTAFSNSVNCPSVMGNFRLSV